MAQMPKDAKRFGIFFFYDGQGVVDDYVDVMVGDMLKNLDELLIVVNGKLNQEGREKFEAWADRLIVRENQGLDAWAYKTALESAGWDYLANFDEIIMFNATIMGPVYPFREMFESMNPRDIDFWGINWFHKVNYDPFGTTPDGYIPRHIQSHFHAYRKSLFSTQVFQDYWKNLPQIEDYNDSVGKHEVPFTKRFEDLGFKSDVYVNTQDLEGYNFAPIMFAPVKIIKEKRCPIFKRRSFFHDYRDVLFQSLGSDTMELYEYLRDHTDYDVNLIWNNALRTMNLRSLIDNLKLTYVFPTQALNPPIDPQAPAPKLALILHVYYMDLLDKTLRYARSMPAGSDIIVTVGGEEKAQLVRQACADMPYNVEVRLIENRGRDVSALLVACKDIIDRYDLVCFAHDKKVTQLEQGSVGDGFADKCFDNLLVSPQYVSNLIQKFVQEPRLGMLFPAPPNHGDYFAPFVYTNWGLNYENTVELLQRLGLNVPLNRKVEPIAPLGTMFWFRPQALKPLYDQDWQWEDFPPEPNNTDGTILHAIERAYAYTAQGAGYFSGICFSDEFSRIELTNLAFYTKNMFDVHSLPLPISGKGTLPVRILKKVLSPTHYAQLRNHWRKYREGRA